MKKMRLLLLLGLTVAVAAAGCGNKEDNEETEFTTQAPEETSVEDLDTAELLLEDETESEVPLDPITPSDYLVKNVADYVTPGDLTGLKATEYTYEITDDMIQDVIDMDLETFSEEIEVDRPSAAGDIIYAEVTSTVQSGEAPSSESIYFTLGDEEYGAEFDQQMTGVSAGDTLQFSIGFDNDTLIDEWAGQTVDFDAAITSVCELSIPEYDDAFISEYTDFDSKEEYEASIRDYLASDYENTGYSDAVEELFDAAIAQSVFSGYPEDLYASCKDEILAFYGAFSGSSDIEEIYDMFDITEVEIDTETVAAVNRRLLVSAICEANNFELTEEDYVSYLEEYADYYGCENAAAFEEEYTRDTLVWALYESMAGEFLYENAEITKEPYVEDVIEDIEDIDIEEAWPEEALSEEVSTEDFPENAETETEAQ